MNVSQVAHELDAHGYNTDPVMVRTEDGKMHSVKRVEYEPRSEDGEGNATSTGGTMWIDVEEY